MARTLYAWKDGGKFYLSVFREPRAHDGVRPAKEFSTETELLEETGWRRDSDQTPVSVIWENEDDGE